MRLYLKTPLEMEKTKFMPEIYQNKRTYTIAFIVTSLVATYLYAWRKNYIVCLLIKIKNFEIINNRRNNGLEKEEQ